MRWKTKCCICSCRHFSSQCKRPHLNFNATTSRAAYKVCPTSPLILATNDRKVLSFDSFDIKSRIWNEIFHWLNCIWYISQYTNMYIKMKWHLDKISQAPIVSEVVILTTFCVGNDEIFMTVTALIFHCKHKLYPMNKQNESTKNYEYNQTKTTNWT